MSRLTLSSEDRPASAVRASGPERSVLRRRRAFVPDSRGLSSPWLLDPRLLNEVPPAPALPGRLPAVLVVAEAADVRNAVARELARDFELLNATTFASAVRQLSEGPTPAALIVDLELGDRRGAPGLLAWLVEHAYAGPRVLLSGALERERACSLRRGSVSHFTLARPWSTGELRSVLDTTLGFYGLSWAPSQ